VSGTTLALAISVVAFVLSVGSGILAWLAQREATATRGELKRHRYSHTVQREEQPARRHSDTPGPPPVADEFAALPTAEMRTLPPPGTRRRVRDDPQA
jgi:hypothetical protein